MSIEHVKAVLDSPHQIEGGQFKVLVALAEWANAEGTCWYPISEIAYRAGRGYRATIYILQQLEEAGYITIERGGGRGSGSVYTVQIQALSAPKPGHEKVRSRAEKVQWSKKKGAEVVAPIGTGKGANEGHIGAGILAPYEAEIGEQILAPNGAHNGGYSEIKGAIQTAEKVQSEQQKVQFSEEKVQFADEKGANSIAPQPLLINHQYNHQDNHQDVNHQDSRKSAAKKGTAPKQAEKPAAVGGGTRKKREPKYRWPEDFSPNYLWRRVQEEFGKLTWSAATFARETKAANVIANAEFEDGVTEEDIVAFLKYVAACDRRWKANGAEMPMLSRHYEQFGAWWAAGKPEQPQEQQKGGYANGNGNGHGALRGRAEQGLSKGNRAVISNFRLAKIINATGGDSEEFLGGSTIAP